MKIFRLENMTRGWFVGNFEPTAYKTESCEVAVKKYKAGDKEESHYHNHSTERTVILSGKIKMNGTIYTDGCIIVIAPKEQTDFVSLSDSITVVYKSISIKNDKYTH